MELILQGWLGLDSDSNIGISQKGLKKNTVTYIQVLRQK